VKSFLSIASSPMDSFLRSWLL